jgi:Xaa-Pro aminopeptidase
MFEPGAVSFSIADILRKRTATVEKVNPTEIMKAVKNPVEIMHLKKAYLLDSVCLCRFICWFKSNIGKTEITELSAAEYLDGLRSKIPGFLDLSFPTISAYGANAAMAHYSATAENYSVVEQRGFLLVDSGGQYLGGTTDVTRTMKAGELTAEEKRDFTLVAVSNLNLMNAKFRHGVTGRFLDAYARAPLWEYGIDYNHGTGHGIGYILNVHEGPHNIRWRFLPGQKEAVFEPGMIVSDEPGVYIEGKYGIRTESIVLTVEDETNAFGRFLRFEPLTYAPIDLDAIDFSYMQPKDIERLNAYHALVWEKIAPYLEGAELEWLREATREVKRG